MHVGSLNLHPGSLNRSDLLSIEIAGFPPSSVTRILGLEGSMFNMFLTDLANTPPGVAWQVITELVFPFKNQVDDVKPPFFIDFLFQASLYSFWNC